MSFDKIIKEGSGKYVWSVHIIMNNFGSFHVVQVLKFQNIKLNIICIWIFIRCATSNVSHGFILKIFSGFKYCKWGMWFPKLSNHI